MLHVTAIFTYIWLEFMINVDRYSIHEACGYDQVLFGVISNSKLMKDDDLHPKRWSCRKWSCWMTWLRICFRFIFWTGVDQLVSCLHPFCF